MKGSSREIILSSGSRQPAQITALLGGVLLILFMCADSAWTLSLDPCSFLEAPAGFELSVSNDAFGPGPVQEWDDLRTFGGELSARLDSHRAIDIRFDALTYRSSTPETGSRIDRIEVRVRDALLWIRSNLVSLISTAAIGIISYGDFEGLAMQERLHDGAGISRPAPLEYDPERRLGLSGSLALQAALAVPGPFIPSLVAVMTGELPGAWEGEAGGEVSVGGIGSQFAVWAAYRYRSAGVSPAADEVSRSMCGPVVGLSVSAGVLTSSLEVDTLAGATLGTFGVRIDQEGRDLHRGPPLALEIFSNVPVLSPGRRVLFPLSGRDLRGYVESSFGWWGTAGTQDIGFRNAEYGAGLEGRLSFSLGMFEAELGCGGGPFASIITLQPTTVERSWILDTTLLLGLRLQPTLRLGFETRTHDGSRTRTGIGVPLCFDTPFLPIRAFASSSAPTNQMFKFRAFLYSEGL